VDHLRWRLRHGRQAARNSTGGSGGEQRGRRTSRWKSTLARWSTVVAVFALLVAATLAWQQDRGQERAVGQPMHSAPPAPSGYFPTRPPTTWSQLPGDAACGQQVHESSWEPRPDNNRPNHTIPPSDAVHASLAAKPRDSNYAAIWYTWLRPRVTGAHVGTTDENIQWAACKWGISDNLLRAIAVHESTWTQYDTYSSGRCVGTMGCGDMITQPSAASRKYCAFISRYGHDYERDYGQGRCPATFSIVGVKSWQDPAWGAMVDNQNGTFPYSRDSTAFALDYLASFLRGCYEGWIPWLANTGNGSYTAGHLWGCVGVWYAGAWESAAARNYTAAVSTVLRNRTWLERAFAQQAPPCSTEWGCPRSRTARLGPANGQR
jgi:hypothetical protein